MRQTRILALIALAVGGAVAPTGAGTLYLPVLDPRGAAAGGRTTEVSVTSSADVTRTFHVTYLGPDTDGTKRSGPPASHAVMAGRTLRLANVGVAGEFGMLEIDADASLGVGAALVPSSASQAAVGRSPVPVIGSENLLAAGRTVQLPGLRRDPARGETTDLGLVNLGWKSAQCPLRLFRADASAITTSIVLALQPLSLRHFVDALGVVGETAAGDARAQVSCTQPFYAYAVLSGGASGQPTFVLPAPTGASTLERPQAPLPPPTPGATVVFTANGLLHAAARGNEKRRIEVPVSRELALRQLVLEMEFIPGPWNPAKVPGNHAIVWLYRGKFRSNTIANVNAFGPQKYTIKNNQNVDLPRGAVTSDEVSLALEQGKRYHLRYVYDAAAQTVTGAISLDGVVLRTFSHKATAENRVLDVPASGLICEFGHWADQEGPEVASYGWMYGNLRIEMTPY